MMVSAAEPPSLRALGTYSPLPEEMGVDYLIPCPLGMVGVQRKEISDLIASRSDGRLARELAQMKQLDVAILVIEGRLKWTTDGYLLTSHARWSRTEHLGLIFSVQHSNIYVNSTDSLTETKHYLSALESWMMKPKHTGIVTRPKPQTNWGTRTNRDFAVHFVQGLDGVGPGVAGALVDKYGFPFTLNLSKEELQSVEGIGAKRAEKIWQLFNS